VRGFRKDCDLLGVFEAREGGRWKGEAGKGWGKRRRDVGVLGWSQWLIVAVEQRIRPEIIGIWFQHHDVCTILWLSAVLSFESNESNVSQIKRGLGKSNDPPV
jgi:hypothetical protein